MNWKRKVDVQSYEAYHAAMRRAERVLRAYLKNGMLCWVSRAPVGSDLESQGTYRKEKPK